LVNNVIDYIILEEREKMNPSLKKGSRGKLVALFAIGAFLLAACSGTTSSTESTSEAEATEASSDIKVAFVSQIEGIPYFAGMKAGGEQAAKDLGITYTHTGPAKADSTEQVKIFDNLIAQGYSAIAVSPLDPTSIANSIKNAQDAGIRVATSDADASSTTREVFVAQASDEGLGSTVMDALATAMGSEGEYGIVSGGADWATGNAWIDAAQKRAASTYPNMKLVGDIRYTSDTAQALQEAQNLMTKFPNLKGIIAVPSTAVPGVSQAVENANMIGKVAVTGFGSPKTAGPFLESGAMTSTVLWDVKALGYLTVWALYQMALGNEFAAENTVPGFDKPVTYDSATKILLLGDPTIFTKDTYKNYDF
jgi:rhamnose transport system substrate-binding protein